MARKLPAYITSTNRLTGRHADRHTHRQTHRQTDKTHKTKQTFTMKTEKITIVFAAKASEHISKNADP